MKQQIIQISNIKFTEPIRIKKPVDITDTYIYEELYRQNDPMLAAVMKQLNMADIEAASHRGFVLAQLLNFYDCTYDVETITPNDVRYQEAVDEIATYVETDWIMDDADIVQSADIELLDETYDFEYQHTLYMYFDDWIQFGYEAYVASSNWEAAFHQIIYEYMRRFLTIEIS
jgi:hypothetical protein